MFYLFILFIFETKLENRPVFYPVDRAYDITRPKQRIHLYIWL